MAKRIIAGLLLALGLLTALAGCAGPETWTPKPYLEINGEAVENPSPEKLRAGLESLDSSAESYVYLELAQPLDGVWYLSAALPMAEYDRKGHKMATHKRKKRLRKNRHKKK